MNLKAIKHKKQLLSQCLKTSHILVSNQKLSQNYYQILDIDEKSDKKEIRLAYIRLCKRFHPDLNHHQNDPELQDMNTNKLQDINKAYNCLIKDDERLAYDECLRRRRVRTSERDPRHHYQHFHGYDNTPNTEHYYEQIRRRQYEDFFRRPKGDGYNRRTTRRVAPLDVISFIRYIIGFAFVMQTISYFGHRRMESIWRDNSDQYQQIRHKTKQRTQQKVEKSNEIKVN